MHKMRFLLEQVISPIQVNNPQVNSFTKQFQELCSDFSVLETFNSSVNPHPQSLPI